MRFDLGLPTLSPPAMIDAGLQRALGVAMKAEGVRPYAMASGAGHDAAVFTAMGVPTGIVYIRNRNDSHNPDEAMAFEDFAIGWG